MTEPSTRRLTDRMGVDSPRRPHHQRGRRICHRIAERRRIIGALRDPKWTEHIDFYSRLEIPIEGYGTISGPYSFVPGAWYDRSVQTLSEGNERGSPHGVTGERRALQ